jgi:hypothetical protein
LKKLDIVLLSRDWELLFSTIVGWLNPRVMSDHSPIIISTSGSPQVGNRYFKFELFWLKHPDFYPNIERIWAEPTRDGVALDRVEFKLKNVKKYLKGWGFNLSGARKKRKHTIQEELRDLEILEEHGALDEDHIRSRVDLNTELFQILEDEELYWYKRCHED